MGKRWEHLPEEERQAKVKKARVAFAALIASCLVGAGLIITLAASW